MPIAGASDREVKHFDVVRPGKTIKPATAGKPPPAVAPTSTDFKLQYPGSGWLSQLTRPASYWYGLLPALWFGATVALALYAYSLAPWRGLPLSARQVAWLMTGLLLAWGAAILASWGQAAIMYGRIRLADHRSLPVRLWGGPALTAAGPQSIINAIVVAAFVVLAAGSIGMINLVNLTSEAPVWAVTVSLFAGYMLLLYLVVALLMLRRLAVASVVLAGMTGRAAIRQALAWIMARPEAITLEIYEAMLWIAGWAVLAAAIYHLSDQPLLILITGSSLAAVIVAFVQQLRSSGWQQALYYQLASLENGNRRAQLLGGRQPEQVGTSRIIAFVWVLVIIAVVAAGIVVYQPILALPY